MSQLSQFIAASTMSLFLMPTAFADMSSSEVPPLAAVRYYLKTDMVIKMENQTWNDVFIKTNIFNTFAKIDEDTPEGLASSAYKLSPWTTKIFTIRQMNDSYVQETRKFVIISNPEAPEENAYHFAVNQSMLTVKNEIVPASLSSYIISPEKSFFKVDIHSDESITSLTILYK